MKSNHHELLNITPYLVSTSQLVYVNLGLKSRHAVCRHKANGLQLFLAKNMLETDICICQIHGGAACETCQSLLKVLAEL